MPKEDDFLSNIDKSDFSTESYVTRAEKPWGYELYFIAPDQQYMVKNMHINAGCRQSMQVHDAKSETYILIKGRAAVLAENSKGEMIQVELEPEKGFTTKVGQRHRLIGISDCDIFEASTPETGITIRLEDDYARPNETDEMRSQPNRGWDNSAS